MLPQFLNILSPFTHKKPLIDTTGNIHSTAVLPDSGVHRYFAQI
jgi:hypothetical protein